MGVKGLWSLLADAGVAVSLESLQGKTLAIDASIWLHQFLKAMRTKDGNPIQDAHIIGFFQRICKLKYYKINPIFVFDGKTPQLKLLEIQQRRNARENSQKDLKLTAEKILQNQLKIAAIQYLKCLYNNLRLLNNEPNHSQIKINTLKRKSDEYELPTEISHKISFFDPRLISDIELRNFVHSYVAENSISTPNNIDFESNAFKNLPINIQHQIILDLKLQSRKLSQEQFQEMISFANDSLQFSKNQIKNLVNRNYLTEKAFDVAKIDPLSRNPKSHEMGGSLRKRVAGEKNLSFALIKENKGGYAMKLDQLQPIKNTKRINYDSLDVVLSSESDDDSTNENILTSFTYPEIGDTNINKRISDFEAQGNLSFYENSLFSTEYTPEEINHGTHNLFESDIKYNTIDDLMTSYISKIPKHAVNEIPEKISLLKTISYEWTVSNIFDEIDSVVKSRGKCTIGSERDISLSFYQNFLNDLLELRLEESNFSINENHSICSDDSDEIEDFVKVETIDFTSVKDSTDDADGSIIHSKQNYPTESFHENQYKPTQVTNQYDINEELEFDLDLFMDGLNSNEKNSDNQNLDLFNDEETYTRINVKNLLETDKVNSNEIEIIENNQNLLDQNQNLSDQNQNLLEANSNEFENNQDMNQNLLDKNQNLLEVHTNEIEIIENNQNLLDNNLLDKNQNLLDQNLLDKNQNLLEVHTNEFEIIENNQNLLDNNLLDTNQNLLDQNLLGKNQNLLEVHTNEFEIIENNRNLLDQNQNISDKNLLDKNQNILGDNPKELEATELQRIDVGIDIEDESQEFELFLSQTLKDPYLKTKDLQNQNAILEQRQKQRMRDSSTVSSSMISDILELLELFGLPWVISPMEAESQCAYLNTVGLVDGIVTDDSDIFLFGGDKIYRHFFNQQKYCTEFRMDNLRKQKDLGREELIQLAYLLGSDYTSGISGVGVVTGMKILKEFKGERIEGLKEFKRWNEQGGNKIKGIGRFKIEEGFPREEVYEGYMNPVVDKDEREFVFGLFDVEGIKRRMLRVGMAREKIERAMGMLN